MPPIADSVKKTQARSKYRLHRLTSNRSSARSLEQENATLTPVQQRVVDELRTDGLALVPFDELVGDPELWAALERDMTAFTAEAEQKADPSKPAKKESDFLIKSRKKKEPLSPDDPLLRYALNDAVLSVANHSLGMWSKLISVDRWYTVPTGTDGSRISSQRWHRDHIDQNILKIFTYFSDVDEAAGPLEVIRGSAAGGRYGDLWPWTPKGGDDYPPQDELEQRTAAEDRVAATGPRGTMVFANTGAFHRGGFGTKPRIMSMQHFVSPASLSALTKRRFTLEHDGNGNGRALSPAAEFALS